MSIISGAGKEKKAVWECLRVLRIFLTKQKRDGYVYKRIHHPVAAYVIFEMFLVCHNYGRRKSRKEEEGEETIYYYTSLFEYIESDEETRFPISKRSCFSYSVLLLK